MQRRLSRTLTLAVVFGISAVGLLGSARAAAKSAKESTDVEVTGKTACAHCKFGKVPVSDSASMGIAVEAGSKVYIVEGGEKKYPKIYEDRFDGFSVKLKGKVKKAEKDEGKTFLWVDPSSLELVEK